MNEQPSTADRAIFEDLEEVARALISRAAGPRERMYELLTTASFAHVDGRYDEARAALGQLHHLALHGGET